MSNNYKYNVELVRGHVRWFYRILGRNGEPMLTSQKYFSKSNAKRAAQDVALNIGAKFTEVK